MSRNKNAKHDKNDIQRLAPEALAQARARRLRALDAAELESVQGGLVVTPLAPAILLPIIFGMILPMPDIIKGLNVTR